MITKCPHCGSIFRVNTNQLKVAGGEVRCGHCKEVFDAAGHMVKPGADGKKDSPPPPPAKKSVNKTRRTDNQNLSDREIADLLESELDDSKMSPGALLFWFLLSGVLAALLAAQYLWYSDRDLLLQNPYARPWLARACQQLDRFTPCQIPATRAPGRIRVSQRFIDRHPSREDASLVHLEFENKAEFPQPYPLVELRFNDESGEMVAARRFKPPEYLPGDKAPGELMAVGEKVHFKLEFQDQVENMYTYGFSISFL